MKRRLKMQRRLSAFVMMLVMIITMFPASVIKAEQYDVNPPVLSDFTLSENGQTVEVGGELHITFKAVDAEEAEIQKENVTLQIGNKKGDVTYLSGYNPVMLEKQDEVYHATFQLHSSVIGQCYLEYFEVSDSSGNSAKLELGTLPEEERYTFTAESAEIPTNVVITDIVFSQDKVVLTEEQPSCGINVSFKVEDRTGLPDELKVKLRMVLKDSDGNVVLYSSTATGTYAYDESDGYYKYASVIPEIDYTFTIYKDNNGSTFEFERIEIEGTTVTCDIKKSIEIVREFTDNEAPVLKDIYFTKNGERLETGAVVTEGDEIKVVAEVEDSNRKDFVRIYLATDLKNITENSKGLLLHYIETSQLYEGIVDVANFYPTEWYLEAFSAEDEYGNKTYITDSFALLEDKNFLLKKEDTCVIPTYNIKVGVRNADGNSIGSYEIASERTTSLNTLFPNGIPSREELESDGRKIIGWYWGGNYETLLDEDDAITLERIQNQYYSLEPAYDKVDVWVYTDYLDKNGERVSLTQKVETEWGTTYRELIEQLDLPKDHGSAYEFVKWNYGWSEEELDGKIIGRGHISIKAEYKKYPLKYSYSYLTKDNQVKTETVSTIVEKGTTAREAGKSIHLPADALEKENLGWCIDNITMYWLDEEISLWNNEFSFAAQYSDMRPVRIVHEYANPNVQVVENESYMYIPADMTLEEDVIQQAMELINKAGHSIPDSLKIQDYAKRASINTEFENGYGRISSVYVTDLYDKTIIQLVYGVNKVEGVILDIGETYTFPTSYDAYTLSWFAEGFVDDYEWEYLEEIDSITAYDGLWYVRANPDYYDKNGELVFDVDLSDKPDISNPDAEGDSSNTDTNIPSTDEDTPNTNTPSTEESKPSSENSAIELEAAVVEEKAQVIKSADAGSTITINMKKENGQVATVVPVEILEAAKGKDVNVVLNMGSYSWTINGKNINAAQLQDINLEVKLDTNAVPSATINALAEGKPTRQISLTHNGNFGFKASLTVNVGSDHQGEYGNLYYHDSNGKLVFMNAGKIQADGSVSLDFSHASDYVIVISENQHTITTSPVTNDVNLTWLWFMLFIAAFGIIKGTAEYRKSKVTV